MTCAWISVLSFLAFPALMFLYWLIADYIKLHERVRSLEWHKDNNFRWLHERVEELQKAEHNRLYNGK